MDSNSSLGAIVVAAGSSTRMKGVDKTFNPILSKPMITYCLDTLDSFQAINQIVLVVSKDSITRGQDILKTKKYKKLTTVCAGGERRQDSVRIGLENLHNCSYVLVHDGASPCLDISILERGWDHVKLCGAALAGVPVKDTIKIVSPEGKVQNTPQRDSLWAAQTPQFFRYDWLHEAHQHFQDTVTDDASMVERLGHPVQMFLGSYDNLKITTVEDLSIAETWIAKKVNQNI